MINQDTTEIEQLKRDISAARRDEAHWYTRVKQAWKNVGFFNRFMFMITGCIDLSKYDIIFDDAELAEVEKDGDYLAPFPEMTVPVSLFCPNCFAASVDEKEQCLQCNGTSTVIVAVPVSRDSLNNLWGNMLAHQTVTSNKL